MFTLAHFAFEHEHRLHRTFDPYLHHDTGKRTVVVDVLATPRENAAYLKRTLQRRTLFATIRRFAAHTRTRYSEHALQNRIQTRFRAILLSVRYLRCFFCCYFGWCRPGRHDSVVLGDIVPELCTGRPSRVRVVRPTGILKPTTRVCAYTSAYARGSAWSSSIARLAIGVDLPP